MAHDLTAIAESGISPDQFTNEEVTDFKPSRITCNNHRDRIERLRNPPAPIVDGYIYEGTINVLVALPGEGKTLVAIALAESIAGGTSFAERESTAESTVLFICTDSPDDTERRLSIIPCETSDRILSIPEFPQLPNGISTLKSTIERYNPKAVILDTWDSIRTHTDSGYAGQDASIEDIMRELRSIARSHKCAFIITHHATRNDNGRPRGSVVFDARADTIGLVSNKQGNVSLSLTKNRRGPKGQIGTFSIGSQICPDGETCPTLHYLGQSHDKGYNLKSILSAIQEGPITQRNLAERVNIPAGSISSILSKIRKDGFIEEGSPLKLSEAGMSWIKNETTLNP